MGRLIDADVLTKTLDDTIADKNNVKLTEILLADFAKQILSDTPTVDAVPVVRCKDCGYWDATQELCWHMLTDDENGYCSWGERREDD